MKAVLCKAYEGWKALELGVAPDPVLGPGQVLVDVKGSGLNFPDLLLVAGRYQMKPEIPFIPGSECAGEIAALGEGVKGWNVGDRVIAYTMLGGMAEQAVVPATNLVPLPKGMSFAQGAGFTTTFATSCYALKQRANLQPGETVLVLGAAGGVGLAAVELAVAMGAKVIAAASTDEKLKLAKAHGASEGINYTSEDLKARVKDLTQGQGVDVIYDPVGGEMAEPAFRSIAFNGRYLVIGFAAGVIPKLPLNLPLLKTASIVGVFWGAWAMRDPQAHAKNMREMLNMFGQGKLRVTVSAEIPAADFAKGFEMLENRQAKGKLTLSWR